MRNTKLVPDGGVPGPVPTKVGPPSSVPASPLPPLVITRENADEWYFAGGQLVIHDATERAYSVAVGSVDDADAITEMVRRANAFPGLVACREALRVLEEMATDAGDRDCITMTHYGLVEALRVARVALAKADTAGMGA